MATTTTTPPIGADTEGVKHRQKAPRNPGQAGWIVRIVLGIICFLWIVPVIGALITSFRSEEDANSTGWWTILTNPSLTLDNYKNVIHQADLGAAFINSFAIALPATFIPILIAAFAAYAFTFMEFPGREVLFVIVVSLLVVPNYVSFVPILKIYADINLAGQFPAAWLAHIGFGMSLAIYILRNYMSTLPRTVIESAEIDGASHFQTFYRLILPMSVPALASFAIFQFLWVWNDLLVALIFIQPGDNEPITVATAQLVGQQGQNWNLVTAGGMLSMLVPVAVFLALQRYFVRGLTAGAVKG
jgi:alpha-glucoside transport system permease protein